MKMDPKAAAELWSTVKAVAFDVDSTVCTDEGIDKLAVYCDVADEVAEWCVSAASRPHVPPCSGGKTAHPDWCF